MTYSKTVLCLANSRKPPSGRCVAGKELSADGYGAWIRPVSNRNSREISEEERRYEDGRTAQVLDVVELLFLQPIPIDHQTENHLIDADYYWVKSRIATWEDVIAAADSIDGPLWINGYSTYLGYNDKIPEDQAGQLDSSLTLLRLPTLTIQVEVESGYAGQPGRRRVRARFDLAGHHYSMVVTDPIVEAHYFAGKNGNYILQDTIICVSLSEPIYGHVHKLAAAVITEERCKSVS